MMVRQEECTFLAELEGSSLGERLEVLLQTCNARVEAEDMSKKLGVGEMEKMLVEKEQYITYEHFQRLQVK